MRFGASYVSVNERLDYYLLDYVHKSEIVQEDFEGLLFQKITVYTFQQQRQ